MDEVGHMMPPGGSYVACVPRPLLLSRTALPGPAPGCASPVEFIFLSMNIGFLPSLSNCLNRIRGFSSMPKQRSLSPYTIYNAYCSQGALILYFLSAAGRTL